MSPADGLQPGLGQPEVSNLPFRNQFFHRTGDVLNRHCRVYPMLVQQIDALGAQPLQASLDGCLDMRRLAVGAGTSRTGYRVDIEAELGGDHHLVAHRRQRLAHQFFIGERAIGFRRIEVGNAPLHRRADQRDHLLLVCRRAVARAHAHAAQAEGGDFKALSESACLHGATVRPHHACLQGHNRISLISNAHQ